MRKESASQCDRCGDIVADIDAGFSPALQRMQCECGGTWEHVYWTRETGKTSAVKASVYRSMPAHRRHHILMLAQSCMHFATQADSTTDPEAREGLRGLCEVASNIALRLARTG